MTQSIEDLIERTLLLVRGNQSLHNLSIALTFSVALLFFFAPEDSTGVFPPIGGSRFYWTPLIPIISSLAIMIWAFSSLNERLEIIHTKHASIGVPLLIFLSLQFATTSPVGIDGWLFLEFSQYFSTFGHSGVAYYTSHPLVMLPVDFSIRILGGSGRTAAALTGFALSLFWLNTIFSALSKSPSFRRNGVLLSLGLCLFFILTSWYPLRYSAHLLGLVLGHHLLYSERNEGKIAYSDLFIAFLLGVSHPFAPIVFGAILYIESLLGKSSSSRSRFLFLVIALTFALWNTHMDLQKFEKYLPLTDPKAAELQIYLSLLIFLGYLSSVALSRKLDLGKREIFGGAPSTHNISVVLGCILCIPILLVADTTSGGSRFTHRLVTYSSVPLMWSGGWLMNKFFHRILDWEIMMFGKNRPFEAIIISLLAVFSGIGGAILQDSFVSSAQVYPEDTVECWDMVEESGSLGIIMLENQTTGQPYASYIIISAQMVPPIKGLKYYSFLRDGDGTRIPNAPVGTIRGVLETPGLFEKLPQLTEASFENWTLVGEVEGACRMWVPQNAMVLLDPTMTWDLVYARYPNPP